MAQKAANRVASFDPEGKKGLRSLLPKELDAKAEVDPNFGSDIKNFGGGSDNKPQEPGQ